MIKTIKIFEAFAGYGSQVLAMERAQIPYSSVGISEIKPEAIKAYRALHGYVRNYGDITQIDWMHVPDFDFFTYSFPCTDISRIGYQAGMASGSGTHSSLLWECEKAIVAKRPKWMLMENVRDILSNKFFDDFKRWMSLLDVLGYNNYYKCINAKDYIPQNRERVFMVSIRKDIDEGFMFNELHDSTNTKTVSDILLPIAPLSSYLQGLSYRNFMRLIRLDDLDNDRNLFLFGHSRDAKGGARNFHNIDCAHCCTTGSVGGGNVGMYVYSSTDNSVRKLTAFEQMRLMGLDDTDINKLFFSGLSPHQIADLGGNGIVVDVLCDIYHNIWPSLVGSAPIKQRGETILTLFD